MATSVGLFVRLVLGLMYLLCFGAHCSVWVILQDENGVRGAGVDGGYEVRGVVVTGLG